MLTIAISSYRRPKSIEVLLRSIARSSSLSPSLKFIIINDSGLDQCNKPYRDVIDSLSSILNITFIDHEENKGYPKSFIEIFSICETKYVMMLADDDLLDLSDIDRLLEFLHEVNPDICSTQYLRENKIYRGQRVSRKATPSEFRELNGHAPGVVYKVDSVLNIVSLVSTRLSENNVIAHTYPQVLFAIDMLLNNMNCWFYAGAFASEGVAMPSGIKDASGAHYSDIASRIQQLAAFDEFINGYPSSLQRDEMLFASRR
ncbi:MAG: glycosyltransferase, partial [Ekhidna sp.]